MIIPSEFVRYANEDSLLKKWSTVFFLEGSHSTGLFRIDECLIRADIHALAVARVDSGEEHFEYALAKVRSAECRFMSKLMGCKERLVKTSGWWYTNHHYCCYVAALGVDSLIEPNVYTQHMPPD